MRNPVTKFTAVAAVILVAGIAGVVLWTHTGSGIALADVLTQVQQITAYMFQMTMTASGKDPNSRGLTWGMEATTLISQDGRMKAVMKSADPNGGTHPDCEMYMLPKEKVMIMLMPGEKQYTRMELDDTLIEKSHQEHYDPGTMLKEILARKHESLGRSTIDGLEVEGFETTDLDDEEGVGGTANLKIWVDVKTKLPVREEIDGETTGVRAHVVAHGFQWNYPVDANTFKPVIPADYKPMPGGDLKMPAMNEEGAIAGLKLCADLTGRYPEKLDHTAITSLMTNLTDARDLVPEPPEPPELPEEEGIEFESTTEDIKKTMELPREERLKKMEELNKRWLEQVAKMEERQKKRQEQFERWEQQRKEWQEQVEKTRPERLRKIEEHAAESMNKLMPMQGTVMYYQMLAQEKKAPVYYGNIVTPEDADKVLMRWKVSDNQYRVIFGSLHAETVSAEVLAELEKDLPK